MDELAILSGVEDLSRFSAVEEPLVGDILCVAGGFFATVAMIKGEEIASVFEFQLRVKTCRLLASSRLRIKRRG